MRYNGFWILASAILLAANAVPARANLITDPGFESCTANGDALPGWTASSGNFVCGSSANTGTFAANETGAETTLSQTITTITGDNYDFSFWLDGFFDTKDNFDAFFGSNQVLGMRPTSDFDYTLEDFTVMATGTSTTIEFDASTLGGGWALDDVSVTDQSSAAPEPASLVLLASGLLAIAWRFRHQRS